MKQGVRPIFSTGLTIHHLYRDIVINQTNNSKIMKLERTLLVLQRRM